MVDNYYASIAKSGKAQEQPAKTRVGLLLVYAKEDKKDQTSEETKIDLQSKLKPK